MHEVPPGPRIYNLFPTLVGSIESWEAHLPQVARMGFNWVFLNPFHAPGASGSLYAVKDYYALHPVVAACSTDAADARLARFTAAAARLGIGVMMDLVINHTARDAPLTEQHPDWYARDEAGGLRAPSVADLDDPSKVTVWEDLAELDYAERPARVQMLRYWDALLAHSIRLGFRGFRCDAAYKVPAQVWAALIGTARAADPGVRFFAETLGAPLQAVEQLRPAGFDYFFNSAKWWDFRADWLLDQYEQFRHIAPSIAFPESHDTPRLAAETGGSERESRLRYLFSAFFASGVMMPIGYEFGFRRPLHVVDTRPEHREEPHFDLRDYVRVTNEMKAQTATLNEEGPQERFTEPDAPLVGLLRRSTSGPQRVAALINPDHEHRRELMCGRLAEVLECDINAVRELTPLRDGIPPAEQRRVRVAPRAMRVFAADD